jgi:hypothetical protein
VRVCMHASMSMCMRVGGEAEEHVNDSNQMEGGEKRLT